MQVGQATVSEAVGSAVVFARGAWRRTGLIQLITAASIAAMFVGLRAPLTPATGYDLAEVGLLFTLGAWAPLWAALQQLALGEPHARGVWPGGLHFGRAELRFLALGGAGVVAACLALLPMVAISAAIFVLFRGLGMVALGPLGHIQISFIFAAAVWLAALAGIGYAAARLALAPAATLARGRLVVVESWPATRGQAGAIAGAWLLAQAPMLLCLAALALVDSFELRDALGSRSRWPLPDALLAGSLLGLVAAFVHAPLSAGVLGFFYRNSRQVAVAAPPRPQGSSSPQPFWPEGAISEAG